MQWGNSCAGSIPQAALRVSLSALGGTEEGEEGIPGRENQKCKGPKAREHMGI